MSNSVLEIVNFWDASSCTVEILTMIDYRSISKDQIKGYIVTTILLNYNDFLATIETNLSFKPETDNINNDRKFLTFLIVKIFGDLGFREWWKAVK